MEVPINQPLKAFVNVWQRLSGHAENVKTHQKGRFWLLCCRGSPVYGKGPKVVCFPSEGSGSATSCRLKMIQPKFGWGSRASWRCVVNPTKDSCTGAFSLQLQHLQSDKRAHQPLIHLTSGNKGISLKSVIFGQGFYFSASSSIVGPMKLQNKVADQHITKYPGVL